MANFSAQLDKDVLKKLIDEAKKEGRSLSKQMEHILKERYHIK